MAVRHVAGTFGRQCVEGFYDSADDVPYVNVFLARLVDAGLLDSTSW
jgi:hypothetical protein